FSKRRCLRQQIDASQFSGFGAGAGIEKQKTAVGAPRDGTGIRPGKSIREPSDLSRFTAGRGNDPRIQKQFGSGREIRDPAAIGRPCYWVLRHHRLASEETVSEDANRLCIERDNTQLGSATNKCQRFSIRREARNV